VTLAKALTSRTSICIVNGLLLLITGASLYQAGKLLFNLTNDFAAIEEILDDLATIFIAYGVGLEERGALMGFSGLYPRFFDAREDAADHLCHAHGLYLLLLGLAMEVSVALIKIPNTIVNTDGVEGLIFGIGLALCAAAGFVLAGLCHRLIRLGPLPPSAAPGAARPPDPAAAP
jgi:hypothetical protein